jgi:hypothetical protein
MMELRPIAFIEDARYRIDREGRVFSMVTKRGRQRTTPEVRFEQLTALTLAEAIELARGLGSYRFELIRRSSMIRMTFDREHNKLGEFEIPYMAAQRINHDGRTPVEVRTIDGHELKSSCEWIGAEVPLVGDGLTGWHSLSSAAGTRKHIFHGPSEARQIFEK